MSHGFYFSAVCFRGKYSSTKRDAHGSRRVVTRSVNPLKRFDVRNEIINGSNIVHANGNLCSFTMLINRESLVISQQARLEYNNVTTHTYEPIIAFHLATGFVGRRYTTPNTHFRVPILHALLTLLLKTLSFSLSLSVTHRQHRSRSLPADLGFDFVRSSMRHDRRPTFQIEDAYIATTRPLIHVFPLKFLTVSFISSYVRETNRSI